MASTDGSFESDIQLILNFLDGKRSRDTVKDKLEIYRENPNRVEVSRKWTRFSPRFIIAFCLVFSNFAFKF